MIQQTEIKTEVGIMKMVVAKLDVSIDKISEVSNNIGKLLAVHDERLSNLEKSHDRRATDISDIHNKLNAQTKEILFEINKIENTLDKKLNDSVIECLKRDEKYEESFKVDFSKLSLRVDNIEKLKYYMIGAAAVIGFVFNFVIDFFQKIK